MRMIPRCLSVCRQWPRSPLPQTWQEYSYPTMRSGVSFRGSQIQTTDTTRSPKGPLGSGTACFYKARQDKGCSR